MTCERCEFIEAEYVRAEAEDLTRDALVLALAAARVERNRLREFVNEEADNDCHYGDNCPSNAGTRHGTCRSCSARQTLAECHSRADSGHVARKGES